MEELIRQIKVISEKTLTYNIDINQHIISCRISMVVIKEQQKIIRELSNKINEDIEKDRMIKIQEQLIQEYNKILQEITK